MILTDSARWNFHFRVAKFDERQTRKAERRGFGQV